MSPEAKQKVLDRLAEVISQLMRHSTFLRDPTIFRFFQGDIADLQNLLVLLNVELDKLPTPLTLTE